MSDVKIKTTILILRRGALSTKRLIRFPNPLAFGRASETRCLVYSTLTFDLVGKSLAGEVQETLVDGGAINARKLIILMFPR